MNYIRKISQTFIDDLNTGKLKKLLDVLKADYELQLEIRQNYISVYFFGGQLFRVKSNLQKSGYNFTFDIRYCLNEQDENFVGAVKKDDIDTWIKAIPTLKRIMKDWHIKNNKLERQLQQNFCRENTKADSLYFVFDMEYQVGSIGRVDMLGFVKRGKELKIVLIELKQKNAALYNKAGLIKHYKDFVHLIENYKDILLETAKSTYANKVSLGLIPNCFDMSTLSGFEILFALYDYNEKGALDKVLSDIKELNENIPFACVKISKGTYNL